MQKFEDIATEAYNSDLVSKIFTCYSHHLPLAATIMTAQSLYQKSAKFQSLINRNLTHIIFTNSKRLHSVLPFIGRDICPEHPKRLQAVFNECIKVTDLGDAKGYKYEPFPYLIAELEPNDARLQFYSGIFQSECLKIFVLEEK